MSDDPRRLGAHDLLQFTGSETFYKHWLGGIVYTEGVQFVAEKGGAYWLIDAVASHQARLRQPAAPGSRWDLARDFQLWWLKVDLQEKDAVLECWADYPDPKGALIIQAIGYTDFPLPEIKLYLRDSTLMLPGEY